MAHNVSNEYKQVIYSQQAKNRIKILFNNVELQDADRYCEKLTVKSRIIPNGAKIFNLNNFISKEADLILHDIDTSIIQNQVSISIGTLVGNSYEYVPIGIFNIENQPTNDKDKTTIKLRDNSVKFDFNYNAQPLIEQNGGVATKLQILQDICSQAGVTCNITSFVGYLDEIGVYDNTITAREYISRIAEQAGRIATINRSGELIFVDLNNLTTWEIPIEVVEKYENGTKFKIGRVVYEDGIVRYETPTSNDDTLFLDGSNNYINGELVKEQASSSDNSYYLENTGEADLAYFELEGNTTQETRSGINLLNITTTTTTQDGITYTVNKDKSITINGTNTKSSTSWLRLAPNFNLSAGTYTLSNGNSNVTYNTFIFYDDKGNIPASGNVSSKTFTSSIEVAPYIRIGGGQTINNQTIYPMIVEGSYTAQTLPQYEPYGLMPSPDYPSELVSVGYENLLNVASIIPATASTTVSLLDTGINLKNTSNGYGAKINIENLKANTDYYISYKWENVSNGLNRVYVFAGSTQATTLAYLNNGTGFKFNTGNNTSINIWFYVQANSTGEVNYKDIQLLEGIQAHSYIPYGKYGIEVKTQGKNLFNEEQLLNAEGWSKNDNGYYYGLRDRLYRNFRNENGGFKFNFKFKENTQYTISFIAYASVNSGNARFEIRYTDGTIQSSGNWNTTTPIKITRTTLANKTIASISYAYGSGGGTTDYLKDILLEEGNKNPEYEEYKLNTQLYLLNEPLRSIGDTKDLLYIKNGMLYVDRKIGKVILNGTESDWTTWGSGVGGYKLSNFVNGNGESNTTLYPINSNYFKAQKQGDIYSGEVGIQAFGGNFNALYVRHNSITTLANWKTWLSTHNTEVQYVLAKPYTEELGQVDMPSTYDDITYIDILSNINTNSYLQYRQNKTQLEAILQNTNQFSIDSLKTGKILGNPAIDSYDLIQIHDKSRNLFDIPDVNYSGYGITIKSTNGVITISGTTTETFVYNFNLISPISSSLGTLTKSLNASGTFSGLQTSLRNNGGNSVGLWTDNARSSTNTISADAYKFRIQINSGITINTTFKPQIEVGNVETDYVPFKDETYTTLATNDLVYTGVLINTFDTQIGEEAKEQNVFVNGEETFKKWARTTIDNVEGSIKLQAGQIDEANGKINETNLIIEKDGALLNVLANNSNIDVQYDSEGNPLSGEVREVTTTTGFTFNAEGMTIEDTSSNFKALHRNTGVTYYDGTTIVGQYTKDGSKQKDLELFGVYYYGKNDFPDTPMFIAQLYTDENGEEAFGHFFNKGD